MRLTERARELSAEILQILRRMIQKLLSLTETVIEHFRNGRKQDASSFQDRNTADPAEDSPSCVSKEQRKILVSYCLYGEKTVRYDGRDIPLSDEIFLKWKKENRLIPVCPEVDGGLPVPRLPSERSGKKVVSLDGRDVTQEYFTGAVHALKLARQHNVAFAVMKEGSPSCGSSSIHDGHFTGNKIHGEGTAVELLRNAGIVVFSEKELEEAADYLAGLESGNYADEESEAIIRRPGIMRGTVK